MKPLERSVSIGSHDGQLGVARKHVVLLTDAAGEDVVTLGAVLFDLELGELEYAGAQVPSRVEKGWARLLTEQVIDQAEIAPLVLALWTLREALHGRALLAFCGQTLCPRSFCKRVQPQLGVGKDRGKVLEVGRAGARR